MVRDLQLRFTSAQITGQVSPAGMSAMTMKAGVIMILSTMLAGLAAMAVLLSTWNCLMAITHYI